MTDDVITQEKAEEYMQVAALVCMDLDVLLECAINGDLDLEGLKRQVADVHREKESLIADAAVRKRRYEAACLLWSMVAASPTPPTASRNIQPTG